MIVKNKDPNIMEIVKIVKILDIKDIRETDKLIDNIVKNTQDNEIIRLILVLDIQ